jgi:hypothetical protein
MTDNIAMKKYRDDVGLFLLSMLPLINDGFICSGTSEALNSSHLTLDGNLCSSRWSRKDGDGTLTWGKSNFSNSIMPLQLILAFNFPCS